MDTHGIDEVEALVGPTPEIYSGDASVYVLRAGVALIERGMAKNFPSDCSSSGLSAT